MEVGKRQVLLALLAAAVVIATTVIVTGTPGNDGENSVECENALTVADPPDDVAASAQAEGSPPLHPPSDLRELGVHAREDGICVHWITAGTASAGTKFIFGATGPFVEADDGSGSQASGYSFHVELHDDGTKVFAPPGTSDALPRELPVSVTRAGRALSVFVPRSELSVDPFPHERFSFRSTVSFEPAGVAQYNDSIPDPEKPELGYDHGRLCPAPCGDLASDDRRRQPVAPTSSQSPSDLRSTANGICRRAGNRLGRLARPRGARALVRYAGKAWPILSSAAADLRSLEPPASWESYLGHLDFQWTKLEELVGSVAPDDDYTLRTVAADADELGRRARLDARGLGVAECEHMRVPPLAAPLGGRPPGPPGGYPPGPPDERPPAPGEA